MEDDIKTNVNPIDETKSTDAVDPSSRAGMMKEILPLEDDKKEASPQATLPIPEVPVEVLSQVEPDKSAILVNILRTINENVIAALRILDAGSAAGSIESPVIRTTPLASITTGALGTIIEGIFNGKVMIGPDGKEYPIPPNYASKSKLVEGDMLKLTVTPTGAFVFKQIGPIERDRLVGTLVHDREVDEFSVIAGDKKYYVLKASITYYHGAEGDETVILVPKHSPSKWAAVENVMKKRIDPATIPTLGI